MNLTKNIEFKNFKSTNSKKKIQKFFKQLINENNYILSSLRKSYKDSFHKSDINKYKKYSKIVIIGIGGSILGAKTIYSFLKNKIKKKFFFIDNFKNDNLIDVLNKKKLNVIVSKSGNTLETITNANILINKKDENIIITENKNSYLRSLANKIKCKIIDHNNYIGGRYSVLSEVGMVPAELMGLSSNKFRVYNQLIKINISLIR